MTSKRVYPVLSIGGAALVGCIIGSTFQRWRNEGVVRAAELIPFNRQPASIVPVGPGGDSLTPSQTHRHKIIMQHGYPSFDNLRTYENFVLSYDRRHRTANWVVEHLTPELIRAKNVDRKKSDFYEDNTIHPYFRSRLEDYKGSGFDRGHLAPAGNHRVSQTAMDQTFTLSNISPQVGAGFNRDAWNHLEQYIRYRAARSKNLWVVTGPLYLPQQEADKKFYVKYQVIGRNHVAVPTHFFKVFIVEPSDGRYELEAYVMQNAPIDSNIPLRAFQVPLDTIERSAGFILFPQVNPKSISKINGNNEYLEKFTAKLKDDLKTIQDNPNKRIMIE